MTDSDKQKIAASFPGEYVTGQLDLEVSDAEFKIFEEGIYAGSMDEKWHVFVLSDIIYFARSWTNFCIYKVFIKRHDHTIALCDFQVSRNDNQYKNKDLAFDTILLKKLLQTYLKREDFYSDPELKLPLIKKTIELHDPNDECKKSVGSNNVGLTRQIHCITTMEEQKQYFDVTGWTELKDAIAGKPDHEPLISLYLQNRQTNAATTFYFDKNATKLLGQITIRHKINPAGLLKM